MQKHKSSKASSVKRNTVKVAPTMTEQAKQQAPAKSGQNNRYALKKWRLHYGIQAVLLPFWSQTSVTKFLSTFLPEGVKPGAGAYTWGPQDIEIAFAVDTRPGRNWSKHRFPYRNIKTIMSALIKSGKRIAVTVHLSFHAQDEKHIGIINENVAAFKKFALLYTNEPNARIKVCPSLEDYLSDQEFQKAVDIIANNFTAEQLKKIGLRRNPDKNASAIKKGGFRQIQIERHSAIICDTCQVWTPDGPFVYSPSHNEDTNSYSIEFGAIRFEDLLSKTPPSKKTFLLWRPAYNLWYKKTGADGEIKYDRNNKDDHNKQPVDKGSFDDTERQLLRRFLRKSK